jgi:hypothetical protein
MFEGFTRTEIATSGARIHLRHGGDGPPLLLLHGNPLTHVFWHKIAPLPAQRFHVVASDLRGYGDSVGPDDAGENNINYSFRAMAQDQVEVMEHWATGNSSSPGTTAAPAPPRGCASITRSGEAAGADRHPAQPSVGYYAQANQKLHFAVWGLSPLRTDSLPLVSKIYWPENADDAIMDAP